MVLFQDKKNDVENIMFENLFVPTEEFFWDFVQSLCKRNKAFCILFGVIFSIAALFFIFLAILVPSVGTLFPAIVLTFTSIYLFFAPSITKRKIFKQVVKRDKLLNAENENSFSKHNVIFYYDEFGPRSAGAAMFKYNQISEINISNIAIYIAIEKTFTAPIKKDAFTIGDYDSFVVFLREKLKDNPKALKGLK